MKRLMLFILTASMLAGPTVFAHTELTSSTPADKTVLNAAPKEITLQFTEAAKLTAVTIQRQGGDEQKLGPLPAAMQDNFTIPAPELMPGSYILSWRALSDDGHIAIGKLTFEVK